MTDAELGRWALVGAEPAGRFLLERVRLRPDFPLVAVCALPSENSAALRTYGLPIAPEYVELLADRQLTGIVVTAPQEYREEIVRAALSAGKRVLVEGSLGISADDACRLADRNLFPGQWSVFHWRRPDADFLAARRIAAEGRLGAMHTIRYLSCSDALVASPASGGWPDVLQQVGPFLFDQLQQLTPARPASVAAWSCPPSRGFQARLEFEDRSSAWIDVQRSSVCGFETGWILEGETGGYRNRRLLTRAADGEILEEELSANSPEETDVLTDLKTAALHAAIAAAGLARAIRSAAIVEAIRESIEVGRGVPLKGSPDSQVKFR